MAIESIDRVLVVGPMGAGKSYAAQRIADMIERPLVQLDRLMLDPDTLTPKPKEQFVEEATRFFASPELEDGWVVDGVYRSLRHITWDNADIIGYIRPGVVMNTLRMTQRTMTGDRSGGQSHASLPVWLRRLYNSRPGDIQKIDETTAEYRERGTTVLQEKSSGKLLAAFALNLELYQSRTGK